MSKCAECDNPVYGRHLCRKHYDMRRRRDAGMKPCVTRGMSIAEKLAHYSRAVESGCIEWQASTVLGYGRVRVGGKTVGAHRVAYELEFGPIPDGLHLLHLCDNRKCINPKHLRPGTPQDNMDDMKSKGRQPCAYGESNHQSKLTNDTVLAIRNTPGTCDELSIIFGISRSVISAVRNGTAWKHLVKTNKESDRDH